MSSNEGGQEKEKEKDAADSIADLLQYLKLATPKSPEKKGKKIVSSFDLDGIVRYIQENKCQNIVIASGAGISTSAGIPDFRTPGTGLYDNLKKYNLSRPEEIFDISYFRKRPEAFTILAKELYPSGKHKPTIGHYFIKLLAEKGVLLRNYTQNVDTLERLAGINSDLLVEAHGSFAAAHCIECHKEHSNDFVKECLFKGEVVRCTYCKGLVKSDIVFFGESLPQRFFKLLNEDMKKCDLLIIIGTSLKVQPFSRIIDMVKENVPRLLINLEEVGTADPMMRSLGLEGGFDFSGEEGCRDVFYKSTCDEGCRKLAKLLGWERELEELYQESNKKIEAAWEKEKKDHNLAE